jgi:hypothetical protein
MEKNILKDILIKKIIKEFDFDFASNQIQSTNKHFPYKAVIIIKFVNLGKFKIVHKFSDKNQAINQINKWKNKITHFTNYTNIPSFVIKTFMVHNYFDTIISFINSIF